MTTYMSGMFTGYAFVVSAGISPGMISSRFLSFSVCSDFIIFWLPLLLFLLIGLLVKSFVSTPLSASKNIF